MRYFAHLAAIVVCFCLAGLTRGEDAYFDLPLADVKLDPALPEPDPNADFRNWRMRQAMLPRVVIEGGEGFLTLGEGMDVVSAATDVTPGARLVLRAPSNREIKGILFVARSDFSGMQPLRFTVAAESAKSEAKQRFLRVLISHCDSQLMSNQPGTAYFRHRAAAAARELGEKTDESNARFQPNRVTELESTLDLFTGTRAVAENLQLDRSLMVQKDDDLTIDVSTIQGITVAAMDFKAMIKDRAPRLDPLAKYIPHDQHAFFFSSFESFTRVMNESHRLGDALFTAVDQRGEDAGVRARYEKQLGLELSLLSKVLGPAMVSSVGITGGDPYFVAGTDLAILFEARDPATLRTLLQGKVMLATGVSPGTQLIEGIETAVFRDDGKGTRCYIATLDDVVLVTNSLAQIAVIAAAKGSDDKSLLQAPEYRFFRDRYVQGDSDETGFFILTDATIRRWCSPKWRIADSRRVRALGEMLNMRVEQRDLVMKGQPVGASSPFGNVEFLTPISELDIAKVSEAEKTAYETWRRQYQSYWRGVFDPIAAKITVNDQKTGIDLSVMPLIAGTDYRQYIDLTQGVKIAAGSGDPHGAAMHFIMAINAKSGLMRSINTFAMGFFPKAGVDPLAWIGPTVSVYADDDPFWAELAKLKGNDAEQFLRKNGYAFPAGVFVESTSALKLAAFMTAARAFVEQSAPNMTLWETRQHGDLSYVRVAASEQAKADMGEVDNLAIFYATTGKGLILSLNEPTLTKALDRLSGKSTTQPATQPWLGESIAFQLSAPWFGSFGRLLGESYSTELQIRAWNALPILNEWKRLYPDQDPVKVHQKLFGTTLLSPGGGEFTWNENFHTLQSSLHGHPGEPKTVEASPEILNLFGDLNTGVTFESKGLRARVEMRSK